MESRKVINVFSFWILVAVLQKRVTTARCKFILQNLKGSIKSPGYPSNYPGDLNCSWLILVPDGYTITLTTESFRLEGASPDCENDALMIYDGLNVSKNAFGSPYCERNGPATIQSSRNYLYIRFITDSYGTFSGFKIDYTAETNCNRTINADNGTITSPRYPNDYYANANCRWHITSSIGTFISLTFQDFKMEGTVGGVGQCYDHVSIYDVIHIGKRLAKTVCGDKLPGKVESTKNEMIIELYTDATVNARGFSAHFTAQEKMNMIATTSKSTTLPLCDVNHFKCGNGSCIDENSRCNQIKDCDDATDEINCAASCSRNNGGCSQSCNVNALWGPYCSCSHGYRLEKDKRNCEDINECVKDNGNCSDKCTNFPGGYKCECSLGYQIGADGSTCQDIDECLVSSCNHQCVNTDGSYYCKCHNGYRMTPSGKCYDINECAIGVPGCYDCVNTVGSYFCNCDTGFIGVENSTRCEDIDECKHNNGGCSHNCTNTFGSYSCHCLPGFQSFDNGVKCQCPNEYMSSADGKSCNKSIAKASCGVAELDNPQLHSKNEFTSREALAWLADISIKVSYLEIMKWGCIATLINKQFLLTTAHCVSISSNPVKPEQLRIRLGIKDKKQDSRKFYSVEAIIIHPEYTQSNSKYKGDLALIKLKNGSALDAKIQPLCLSAAMQASVGERATVISWGRMSKTRFSKQLRQIQIEIQQSANCTWLWRRYYDPSVMHCGKIISGQQKPCLPDSGSPLMLKDDSSKKWYLVGILVHGAGYPVQNPCSYQVNAYYDSSKYYKWITDNISEIF